MGAVQYWRRFIAKFSFIAAPLHALTSVTNTFQWGGKKKKAFDTLKENTSIKPVLALPNLQKPFDIEIDANEYAMGVVLMQYRKPISYHSETFNQVVFNYPTYGISPKREEMEALLVREGNNYTYRSLALTISLSTDQTTTISTLHMHGFSTTS